MITAREQSEKISKLKSLGLTRKQIGIVLHCMEYVFLYADEIEEKCFSRDIIRRLVKKGVLEHHEADRYDGEMWDLTTQFNFKIIGALQNA